MLKHLLLLFVSLSFVVATMGCTSSEPEEESSGADVEMADAIDGAAEEGASEEDPFSSDFGGDEEIAGDLGSDDLAPSDGAEDPFAEGGDDFAADEGGDDFGLDDGGVDDFAMDEGGGDDFAEDTPMEESLGGEDAAPIDELAANDAGGDAFAEPVSEEPMGNDLGGDEPMMDESMAMGDEPEVMEDSFQETPEPTWVPIKKIADQPFNKNGILINAVYIARPGDSMESISQKIYGSDRTEELYTANPSFRSSSLDTGEKVYYNSPNRPNDDSMLKTFYEDVGLAPETYIAQDGDNIRSVSKQLLGDQHSWKEIWATNPDVESKGELVSGVQLRYWANGDVASSPPPMVSNDPPSPPVEEEPPSAPEPPPMPDMASNDPPPPPAPEPPANNDMPPPPPAAPDMASNDPPPPPASPSSDPPPPPPPPAAMGSVEPPPPPPPPPPSMAKKRSKSANGSGDTLSAAAQQEQVMMIAIGAALVFVALILFIIIRKKKARRQIDFNTATQTQIE